MALILAYSVGDCLPVVVKPIAFVVFGVLFVLTVPVFGGVLELILLNGHALAQVEVVVV